MNWFKRKVIDPLLGFLKQGVSPSSLAWAITAGIVVACIPVFGISTLLCLLVIWMFRLNPAVVLLINQFAYPLQFILFLPFLRAGEWLFNAPNIPFSVPQLFEMAKTDFWKMFNMIWKSNLYGLVVYVIVSIPIALILHFILKSVLSRINLKSNTAERRGVSAE